MRRLVPIAVLSVLSACQSTPERFESVTEPLVEAAPEAILPAVLAVAPVIDRTSPLDEGDGPVPTAALRDEVYRGLPGRLYSPLRLEFIDRGGWREGSTAAREGGADAVLEITVTRWDETWLPSAGSVRAAAEAYLFPIAEGDPIWGARLERELALPAHMAPADAPTRRERLAARLAEELLSQLPERDPLAGD
jgi:hypothetical protein